MAAGPGLVPGGRRHRGGDRRAQDRARCLRLALCRAGAAQPERPRGDVGDGLWRARAAGRRPAALAAAGARPRRRRGAGGERPPPTPAHWLAAAAVLVIALAHGARWHTEQAIHALAGLALVRLLLPWCG